MNTDPTAASYAARIIRDLGLQANDTERALIHAWDNPPRKPLPELKGTRESFLYVGRRTRQILGVIARDMGCSCVDELADAALLLFIKQNAPRLLEMHERHAQEEQAILAELRQNEPGLVPAVNEHIEP